jgi:hypothetical protein
MAEGLVDAQTPGGLEEAPHGSQGAALGQVNLIEGTEGRQVALEVEGEFDGGDLVGIAMGEVGDIAFVDAAALAVGLTEVDGLVGLTIGGRPGGAGYVHVHIIRQYSLIYKHNYNFMHVYNLGSKIAVNPMTLRGLPQKIRGEHPLE